MTKKHDKVQNLLPDELDTDLEDEGTAPVRLVCGTGQHWVPESQQQPEVCVVVGSQDTMSIPETQEDTVSSSTLDGHRRNQWGVRVEDWDPNVECEAD